MAQNNATQKSSASKSTAYFIGEIKTLRDEARVRLHLAGADVRDAWQSLSKEAEAVALKLERAIKDAEKSAGTEAARLKLHLAVMDMKKRWELVQPQLQAFAGALAKKGDEATAALKNLPSEQQKLSARLAEMDAADAVQKHIEEAKKEFQSAKNASTRILKDAAKNFRETVEAFRKSFR